MTSKPDLGLIVAILSGCAVVAAIIAGLTTVGSPSTARDRRLDDAHYQAIGAVATAAQCYFQTTHRLPTSIDEARTALVAMNYDNRDCERGALRTDLEELVSYEVAAPDRINLCAEFRRSSPPESRRSFQVYADRFPELAASRSEIGRRCYLIQLRPV
jgi:hypothetical protein